MNYSELVALTKAYSDRYDEEVSDNIPFFFIMVESRVNRLLKTRKQSCRSSTPTQDHREFYDLPPDWAGMRDFQLNIGTPTSNPKTKSFNLLDPKQFESKRNEPFSGSLYYTVIGNSIQIYPIQESGCSLEMVYFQRVPPLTSTNTTNWMSEDNPDIYLAGLCAEVSTFAKDYEAAKGWYDKLAGLVDELDNVDWIERWSGDSLQIRVG